MNIDVKRTFIHVVDQERVVLGRSSSAPALLRWTEPVASSTTQPSSQDLHEINEVDVGTSQSITEVSEHGQEIKTTVVFRNLPPSFTRAMLLSLLDDEGFAGTYDFVYLPIKMKRMTAFGYAFINFTSQATAGRFFTHFTNFNRWSVPHNRCAEVEWSKEQQGLEAQIEHYRHSPVMQLDVPDNIQAIVFKDGVRVPFPPPTRVEAPQGGGKSSSKSSSSVRTKAGSKSSCSSAGGETSSQDPSEDAGRGPLPSPGYAEGNEVHSILRKNQKAARRLRNKLSSQGTDEITMRS